MILLDTNVLSELVRPTPDSNVLAWFDEQPRAALFTSTITQAEMLYGVRLLPEGHRKEALLVAVKDIFAIDMAGKLLGFDEEAATSYATIASARKEMGAPINQFDAMIAAIALCHGATLATRNLKDFANCSITLINPWQ